MTLEETDYIEGKECVCRGEQKLYSIEHVFPKCITVLVHNGRYCYRSLHPLTDVHIITYAVLAHSLMTMMTKRMTKVETPAITMPRISGMFRDEAKIQHNNNTHPPNPPKTAKLTEGAPFPLVHDDVAGRAPPHGILSMHHHIVQGPLLELGGIEI